MTKGFQPHSRNEVASRLDAMKRAIRSGANTIVLLTMARDPLFRAAGCEDAVYELAYSEISRRGECVGPAYWIARLWLTAHGKGDD